MKQNTLLEIAHVSPQLRQSVVITNAVTSALEDSAACVRGTAAAVLTKWIIEESVGDTILENLVDKLISDDLLVRCTAAWCLFWIRQDGDDRTNLKVSAAVGNLRL